MMDERYVQKPPFNIFEESSNHLCIIPGVDPTPQVQRVAAKYNISIANKKFTNISMGQVQQKPAKDALFHGVLKGHWIILQILHLIRSWLKGLNGLKGFLETVFANCHSSFSVFLIFQPPPLPDMGIIPQSILQSSIKVSNEAIQYLKANLRRAYANFYQAFIDKCDKKTNQFKACLFTFCYFHSLVLGGKNSEVKVEVKFITLTIVT